MSFMDELTTLLNTAGLMIAEHACRPMNSETRRQTILACQQLLDRVRVAQSTLIADATTNNDWAGTGARNIADWLAGATKSSYNDAKRKEQLGNALNKSKHLADAVNSGAVSPDTADALADAVNNPPDTATTADIAEGLKGDVCHSPHWGYIISGDLVATYADGSTENCVGGDVFYWPAGHSIRVNEDAEIILFSPQHEHLEVIGHIAKKLGVA